MENDDFFDHEPPEAVCPSCHETGTLEPKLGRVDGEAAAKLDPLDADYIVHGVFLTLGCSACPWRQGDVDTFAAPDPTAPGTGVLFTFEDAEQMLATARAEEGTEDG